LQNKKINKNQFFIRQTTLEDFGETKQQLLQNAKVAVVGCGGLGSIASVYLAGSGIGHLKLIDFDTVNQSNLHRQVFYTVNDLEKPKAKILGKHIKNITPFTEVIIENSAINKSNINSILNGYDIILDCTDNLPIKYLLNDYCVIHDKTLVYGSLFKFDGYVATFNLLINGKRSANLRDAFPKIPKENIPNCSETGTLNTIVGIIGLQQANEVLKIVSNIGKPITNQILIYNSLNNSQFKMQLKPLVSKDKIKTIFTKESYISSNCDYQNEAILITKDKLKKIANNKMVKIISVIENNNTDLPFENVIKIPLSKLKENPISLDQKFKYILICNKGISSYEATLLLKNLHPKVKIFSLKNGISNF